MCGGGVEGKTLYATLKQKGFSQEMQGKWVLLCDLHQASLPFLLSLSLPLLPQLLPRAVFHFKKLSGRGRASWIRNVYQDKQDQMWKLRLNGGE